jgi:D-glycero-alpha-D-manno-heptose-7-phosphate kinase
MIISKTPYRISFFGGGSDYPNWYNRFSGKVISTTINKYLYLTLKKPPIYFNHKYKISYKITEYENYLKNIKHPVVREMLRHLKISHEMEINYDGDLPSRSGMGSSSSFVVGLMIALMKFKGKKISKFSLAKESINFEQKILKEIVGVQDQVAASYGGFNLIKFNKKKIFEINSFRKAEDFKKKLNKNLFLIYTGKQRMAHKIAKTYAGNLSKEKYNNIKEILDITSEAETVIKKNKPDEFGKLLHDAWNVKKSLSYSISNSKIDELYDYGIQNGANGGKLLGAGGGGFILFYVPKKNQKNFKKKIGANKTISFNFENDGSQIILSK